MTAILLNGVLHPAGEALFPATHRGLMFGDSVFETMRLHRGRILFFDDHLDRLGRALAALSIDTPTWPDGGLEAALAGLAGQNGITGDARVRLTVTRRGAGRYLPESTAADWTAIAGSTGAMGWPAEGLHAGFYEDGRKEPSPLSPFKTGSSALYVLAALHARRADLDDAFILNTHGRVAGAVSSNVFAVAGDRIVTPPLAEGCVDGIMRRQVIGVLGKKGMTCSESPLTRQQAMDADEVFLTNAIAGIRRVSRCGGRSYGDTVSKKLFDDLLLLVG